MAAKVTYISHCCQMKLINGGFTYGGKGNVYFMYNNKSDKARKLMMNNTKPGWTQMLRGCRELLIHLCNGEKYSCKRLKEQSHIKEIQIRCTCPGISH